MPPLPAPLPMACRPSASDLANLFGMVKFYKGARGKGIKPIIGADCWITNDTERDKPTRVLICRTARVMASCASCSPAPSSRTSTGPGRSAATG
jgi:hypothetical protein